MPGAPPLPRRSCADKVGSNELHLCNGGYILQLQLRLPPPH